MLPRATQLLHVTEISPRAGGMLWEQQNLSALSPAEYNSDEQAGPLFRLGKITL